MKILVFFGEGKWKGRVEYSQEVGGYIGKLKGNEVIVCGYGKESLRLENTKYIDLYEVIEKVGDVDTERKINKVESRLGVSTAMLTFAKERQKEGSWGRSWKYIEKLATLIEAWKTIIEEEDISIIFHDAGPHLELVALWVIKKMQKNIETIIISTSPIPEKSITFFTDYMMGPNTVAGWPKQISSKQKKKTEKKVKAYARTGNIQDYVRTPSVKSDLETVLNAATFQKLYEEPIQSINKGVYKSCRHIKQFVKRRASSLLYTKPKYDNKYIFFPMHTPTDSQILFRGEPFCEQRFLISHVARNLPMGYKLYVKPHPVRPGKYHFKSLQDISKCPGVKLMSPSTNTHSLIKNSGLVMTINTTVGVEALMHNKRVISVGNSFYQVNDNCKAVRNLYETSDAIVDSLEEPSSYGNSISFLAKLDVASYQGKYSRINKNTDPSKLAESMIDVCKSIRQDSL